MKRISEGCTDPDFHGTKEMALLLLVINEKGTQLYQVCVVILDSSFLPNSRRKAARGRVALCASPRLSSASFELTPPPPRAKICLAPVTSRRASGERRASCARDLFVFARDSTQLSCAEKQKGGLSDDDDADDDDDDDDDDADDDEDDADDADDEGDDDDDDDHDDDDGISRP